MLTGRLSGGSYVMSRSRSRIRPAVGSSKPPIIRSVVVLPQPDGPRSEKNSPVPISSETPSTACTSRNRFSRSSSWISGDAVDGWDVIALRRLSEVAVSCCEASRATQRRLDRWRVARPRTTRAWGGHQSTGASRHLSHGPCAASGAIVGASIGVPFILSSFFSLTPRSRTRASFLGAMALAISLAMSFGAFVAPVLAVTCPDNGNHTAGSVSPASGTSATNFTFSVTYQDTAGETPDSIRLYLSDGTNR